jgi:hypothetical protein
MELLKINSFPIAVHLISAGYAVRGAVIEPTGRASYLFDHTAGAAIASYQAAKAQLDRAEAEARGR